MKQFIYFINIILLVTSAFIASCSDKSNSDNTDEQNNDSLVVITKSQFETEGMQIANPTNNIFEEIIKASGYIVPSPDGKVQISTLIPGVVKTVNKTVGSYVEKGDILCSIESNDIITLQHDLIESSNKLKVLEADFNRMKTLKDENFTSQKNYMNAESDYKNMLARFNALKTKAEMLKLNVNEILDGKISSFVNIYSPIIGYVTTQNCMLGQYVEPQQILMQIVNPNRFYLKLFVFERDLNKLKKGQNILFYSPNNKDEIGYAKLSLIGKSINENNKSIECKADIIKNNKISFIEDMYVEANIVVSEKKVSSLPSDAILKLGNKNIVLELEKEENGNYYFIKKPIIVGESNDKFVEVKDGENLKNVLVKGTYNLKIE